MWRRRSRRRRRSAATLRVEALQVSRSAELCGLTPRLRLAVRHGEQAIADLPQRTSALQRPPAARESRTRTRLPRCAWQGRAGLGRSKPGPSPRAGAESRRADPPGSCAGAQGRRGAGAAFGHARCGQRAPLPRCTWRGKRPGVCRSAACRGPWADAQRPRGAGSLRWGRARRPEAVRRPSAAWGGHGSASETRRDQRGTCFRNFETS